METGTIEKMVKILPKLRFQEFSDDWKKQPIGNQIDLLCGFAFKGNDISEEKNGIPILRGINITEGYIRHSLDIDRYYCGNSRNLKKYFLKEGDLVLGMDGSKVGKNVAIISKQDSNSLLIQRVARIRSKQNTSIKFIYHHIFSPRFHRYVDIVNTSSGIPHISAQQIKDFKIFFPSLPEQQKIATFLSAVDKKIQQLTRKKALLETYKKGVMQKLFSQEIRFKDYNSSKNGILERDFPEWERKKYGEIYSFLSTNSFSRDQLNYEKGDVKNIHYGDIHTKLPTLFNLKDENIPFVNPEIDISRIKTENYCQEGDLVIADASEDYKDIGKAIELIALNGEKVVGGLHTFIARPAKGKISKGFSGYLMQSWKLRKQIMTIAQGTKVLGLSVTRLKNLKLEIPSLEEQQKIANYLSAIDKKSEAVSQQIDKMQSFKKGLLQQMFV